MSLLSAHNKELLTSSPTSPQDLPCPWGAACLPAPTLRTAQHLPTQTSIPGSLHLASHHGTSLGSLSKAWRPICHPHGWEIASPSQASTEVSVFSFYYHFPQAKFVRCCHWKEHPASVQSRSPAGWMGSSWQRWQLRNKLLKSKTPPAPTKARRRAAETEIARRRSRAAHRPAGSRCASGRRYIPPSKGAL